VATQWIFEPQKYQFLSKLGFEITRKESKAAPKNGILQYSLKLKVGFETSKNTCEPPRTWKIREQQNGSGSAHFGHRGFSLGSDDLRTKQSG